MDLKGGKQQEDGNGNGNVVSYFIVFTLHIILLGHEIMEDEMGCTSGMHEGNEKCVQNFNWKT